MVSLITVGFLVSWAGAWLPKPSCVIYKEERRLRKEVLCKWWEAAVTTSGVSSLTRSRSQYSRNIPDKRQLLLKTWCCYSSTLPCCWFRTLRHYCFMHLLELILFEFLSVPTSASHWHLAVGDISLSESAEWSLYWDSYTQFPCLCFEL